MSLERRAFLVGGGALAAATLARSARSAPPPRPRTFVQFLLVGGIDAIWTTDPKLRRELDPACAISYGEREIAQLGDLRVGPLLAPLGDRLRRFAILNGVRTSTVAHPIGIDLMRQLRRTHVPRAPSFGAVLDGELRYRAPLGEIVANFDQIPQVGMEPPSGPRSLSWSWDVHPRLWQQLWRIAQDAPRVAAVDGALAALGGRERLGGDERVAMESTRSLLAALRRAPAPPELLPGPPVRPAEGATRSYTDQMWLRSWQQLPVLGWIVRNRLCTHLFVASGRVEWDSHFSNDPWQRFSTLTFLELLSRFLDGVDAAEGLDGAPLAEEVVVLAASEMGRFPILNFSDGKDHLPEIPILLRGPGIRPGSYGQTDARMLATPISPSSGRPGGARAFVPALEDVGATLLTAFGSRDPVALGYPGKPLPFLLG